MTEFDALSLGGWPPCARVLATDVRGGVGAALIDANGDLAAIELDRYERDDQGRWVEAGSGSVAESGTKVAGDLALAWGHVTHGAVRVRVGQSVSTTTPSDDGWWLFVDRRADDLEPTISVDHVDEG